MSKNGTLSITTCSGNYVSFDFFLKLTVIASCYLDATAKRIGLKRMSSNSDEIATKVAIVCKNINSRVNNAVLLRRHFSKFGEVAKIFSNPAKGSAVIHFKDHVSSCLMKLLGIKHLISLFVQSANIASVF